MLLFGCVHVIRVVIYFFFFKQKTAYEMRISDWSSDVCSSDLTAASIMKRSVASSRTLCQAPLRVSSALAAAAQDGTSSITEKVTPSVCTQCGSAVRSEEHTSELQSLMRISYAVFCLKKKKKKKTSHKQRTNKRTNQTKKKKN